MTSKELARSEQLAGLIRSKKAIKKFMEQDIKKMMEWFDKEIEKLKK